MNQKQPKLQGRRSIRLKGFDYSQPGDYFVTICTHERGCILGKIANMRFHPSEIGSVVQDCWYAIPEHFNNVRCNVVQLMPNHVHGIISIKQRDRVVTRHAVSKPRRDVACNVPTGSSVFFSTISPRARSLGTIIRSFKSAATNAVHKIGLHKESSIWQARFYDHIIRDDISYYYIERYIELNPVFWHLDIENPAVMGDQANLNALRNHLLHELRLDLAAVAYLMQNEIAYRRWRKEDERLVSALRSSDT